jgi:hypothetical protein
MNRNLISSLILKLGTLCCVYLDAGEVFGTFILAYTGVKFFFDVTSYNSVDRTAWLGKVTSQRHACRTGNKMAA